MDTFFAKKFAWCLVLFCKNDGSKPKKIFGWNGELNTSLKLSTSVAKKNCQHLLLKII
jgi:hypothetical protein